MSNLSGNFELYDGEITISYDITQDKINKILDVLLSYYKKNGTVDEVLQQNDNAIIEAPDVLCEIAEIINFKES